jgi:D-glycero-D-manno-heptose 1,7-bisphosphate phosphatase
MSDERHYFVLLDRDGVINRDVPGSVCSIDDFELLPGAGEAVAELNRKGYGAIVITNQACVGRGDLASAELDGIHRLMLEQITEAGGIIDNIYVCPHIDEDDCNCRKPRPGLIEQAHAEYGFDRAATWMVGDSDRDVEAALTAGCRAALVRSGKPVQAALQTGVTVFDNLSDFVRDLEDRQKQS